MHYGQVRITRLADPLPGSPGSFGFRISVAILGAPAAVEATQPHLYVDAYGFLSGPAEVNLLAPGFPRPVPDVVVQKLMAGLQSRARAHEL